MEALIDSYSEYLASKGYPNITQRFSSLVGKSGTCIRFVTSRVVGVDYDFTCHKSAIYEVLVRGRDEVKAMKECGEIEELLNGCLIPVPGYRVISNEIYLGSQELALDENGFYCWHVQFNAEIYKEF